MRTNRLSRWGFLASASVMMTGAISAGCRVDENDILRWETTERGPEKLVAVITHDKYEPAIRVEAALALVRMRPRGGRRVGIPLMVNALAQLPKDVRTKIVEGMLPTLVKEIEKPPPVAQSNQPLPPDGSVPFKDAAFALLSYEKSQLVTDESQESALRAALASWVAADFGHRYDNSSQMFGVEQVIKFLGAPVAKLLPPLINNDQSKIPELARLIAANGDQDAKEAASKRVVEVANYTTSQKWIEALKPAVEEANRGVKLKPSKAQFEAQVVALQDEQLKRLFGAMRKLGGRAAVEFCLTYASNKENKTDRRALAIAALEGNFDQRNPQDLKRILDLAAAEETPDKIRDLAFRRVGEMPREKVIGKLYEIFKADRWQSRWVAAQYAIRMSDTSHIPEILNHLPRGRKPNFSMTEALSYGDWMGNPERMSVKDGNDARTQLQEFFRSPNSAVRTTALGWFFGHGTKKDLSFLEQFHKDRGSIPRCRDDQTDCEWTCYVQKKGGKKDEKEPKEATNIGEFVRYCIVPNIKDRDEDPAQKMKDKGAKKNKANKEGEKK